MANFYMVMTLSDEANVTWLKSLGHAETADWGRSRYPTPGEIRLVLNRTRKYHVDYNVSGPDWYAKIAELPQLDTGSWALLVVQSFSGDENKPHEFYFERGWRNVMEDIVNLLYEVCGPLALVSSADATDVVITPAAE